MTDHRFVPPINEALRFVQMSGIFYCPSNLTEPWGLTLPAMDNCMWFHVVTEGECTVEVDGSEPRTVGTGDLILVPHGLGHRAWGKEEAPTPLVFDLPHEYFGEHYAVMTHGGGGDPAHIVCGGIRFEHPAARHLIDSLPSLIHIEANRSVRSDWIRSTLELLAEETRNPRPGSEAVISRLCDIVIIQAIRSWIDTNRAAQTGWLGALQDEQVGAAIGRIHADPSHPWTVALLADEAAMSRSAFAARFTDLVGESAMKYVTRWRMHLALDILRETDRTIASVAKEVGYDSEAAFSRAFKRVIGSTPRAARHQPERATF